MSGKKEFPALIDVIEHPSFAETGIAAMRARIRSELLHNCGRSGGGEGDFRAISADTLKRLFDLYDGMFFGGQLGPTVSLDPSCSLVFRMSSRMTSAGGKTIRVVSRTRRFGFTKIQTGYQIAISS
ncbi:MAG: hypothetical protein WC889_18295, partial [Myxococcota bacterium]